MYDAILIVFVVICSLIGLLALKQHRKAIEGHHRRIGELEEEVNVLERVVRRVEAEQVKAPGAQSAKTTDVGCGSIFPGSGDFSNLHYSYWPGVPNR